MKKCRHIISQVEEGSIAWELELEPGDELISINGQKIEDVFDYHYLVSLSCWSEKKTEKSGSWKSRKTLKKIWALFLPTA